MPHDDPEPADHGVEEFHNGHLLEAPGGAPSFVPLAEPVAGPPSSQPAGLVPDPEGPTSTVPELPFRPPIPWPGPFHLCTINMRTGCYRIEFRPNHGLVRYLGTMRVDDHGGDLTVSGDLYRFFRFMRPIGGIGSELTSHVAPDAPPGVLGPIDPGRLVPVIPRPLGIPIYERSRYHSYLRVTNVERPPILTHGPCRLTLTAQQYVYTQPAPGSFDGTFPPAPGTRTLTIVLEPRPAPLGFQSSYFEGTVFEAGVPKGSFSMGWVSTFFRKATVEIDTLQDAVEPQSVGGEDMSTVFAKAGWKVNVVHDQTGISAPPGVNPKDCWSNGDLHNLMTMVRNPLTDLDKEWHMHLLVVPAKMGCGRGVMYDTIGVPREGVASFCDDGYPSSQSSFFGTAANKKQRDVPRAYLRSACHEVGHGFNQIHQEQEGGADNSIMTTTPSVADVLEGPTTGAPGVFPDDINLAFNEHVRHHLVHFPDIAVRPGGMTFGSGHSSSVPEADRYFFQPNELELTLEPSQSGLELGEPLELKLTLTNRSGAPLPVPSDIGVEAQHTSITVVDSRGRVRPMPSFVIRTDQVSITELDADKSLESDTRVYWSSKGFAFPEPGKYEIRARTVWTANETPVGVENSTEVWVNYPQTTGDNFAAAALLHPEVGKFVALGGGASHLEEAVARLDNVRAMGQGDEGAPGALRGYEGLRPVKPRARARVPAGNGAGAEARARPRRKAAASAERAEPTARSSKRRKAVAKSR